MECTATANAVQWSKRGMIQWLLRRFYEANHVPPEKCKVVLVTGTAYV